jgi:uncharacterized protein YheU (UPF0270 family)
MGHAPVNFSKVLLAALEAVHVMHTAVQPALHSLFNSSTVPFMQRCPTTYCKQHDGIWSCYKQGSGCRLIGDAESLETLISALLREGTREGPLWAALERHRDSIRAAMPTGEARRLYDCSAHLRRCSPGGSSQRKIQVAGCPAMVSAGGVAFCAGTCCIHLAAGPVEMPLPVAQRPEKERQQLVEEQLALAPGLPSAAFGLMNGQAPSVLRAVTEQTTTLPDEPSHMTQLKAVGMPLTTQVACRCFTTWPTAAGGHCKMTSCTLLPSVTCIWSSIPAVLNGPVEQERMTTASGWRCTAGDAAGGGGAARVGGRRLVGAGGLGPVGAGRRRLRCAAAVPGLPGGGGAARPAVGRLLPRALPRAGRLGRHT